MSKPRGGDPRTSRGAEIMMALRHGWKLRRTYGRPGWWELVPPPGVHTLSRRADGRTVHGLIKAGALCEELADSARGRVVVGAVPSALRAVEHGDGTP